MKRNKNPLLEGGKVLCFEMLDGKYFTMKCRLVYPKFWCNCCFVQRKRQEITGDADSSIKLSITSMLLAIKPCSTAKRGNWNTHLSGGWQRFVLPQSISQCGQNWNLPLIGLGQHCLVLLFLVTVAVQVILRSSLRWTTRTLALPLHHSLRVIRGWGRRGWKEFEGASGISPHFMEFLLSGLYYERIDLQAVAEKISRFVWSIIGVTQTQQPVVGNGFPSQLLKHYSSLTLTLWLNLYRISLKFGSRG